MRATTSTASVFLLALTAAIGLPGSRSGYPSDYFRSPLGIPLILAGNFAEMRDNHFHGGLDIKTNDSEGYRVYAAADGFISRVKVSPFGYGNALYVTHPNGYTTVYGHLGRFRGRIAGHVRQLQQRRKSFDIDQYLGAEQFPVKKGDVIALSGNSGSSSGPHLHFEIRKTSGQVPVNPLLFGLDIADTRPPRIFRVRLYALDDTSGVRVTTESGPELAHGRNASVTIDVSDDGREPTLAAESVEAWGHIAFGIETHDYQDGSRNRLGVYTITLSADDAPVFKSKMEAVSFGDTRFVNAHVDYAERQARRRWIQRSYRLPGNRIPIYEAPNDGVVSVPAGAERAFTYVVADAYGNRSRLAFRVRGIEPPPSVSTEPVALHSTNGFHGATGTSGSNHDHVAPDSTIYSAVFDQPLLIRADGVEASFRAGSFYQNFEFVYSSETGPQGSFSPVHILHNNMVPVHQRYDLSIATNNLPDTLKPKALIASIDDQGKTSSVGGTFEAGFVMARLRSLGRYIVLVDTLAPSIKSLDIAANQSIGRRSTLRFMIDDDLSGIARYDGYLDGKWVLFAYDAKRKLIYHELEAALPSGPHELEIAVEDQKSNVARLSIPFRK